MATHTRDEFGVLGEAFNVKNIGDILKNMKIDCRRGLFGSRIEIRSSGQVENDQNRAAEPLEYLPGPKTLKKVKF